MLSQTLKEMYAYFSLWYLLYKNCLSTTVTAWPRVFNGPCVFFGLNLVKERHPHISEVQEMNSFIDVQEKQIQWIEA